MLLKHKKEGKNMKQTKKDLKELAKSLGAYYCGGNVYSHENIQYCLEVGDFDSITQYASGNNDILVMLNFLDRVYGLNNFNTVSNRKKFIYNWCGVISI